jgi:hypothetical protein
MSHRTRIISSPRGGTKLRVPGRALCDSWRTVICQPSPAAWSTPVNIPAILECAMSKNKGGREVRKPKQAKKPKAVEAQTLMSKVNDPKKAK